MGKPWEDPRLGSTCYSWALARVPNHFLPSQAIPIQEYAQGLLGRRHGRPGLPALVLAAPEWLG